MHVVGTAFDAQSYFDEQRARFDEQRARYFNWVQTYLAQRRHDERSMRHQVGERAAAWTSPAPATVVRASVVPAAQPHSPSAAPSSPLLEVTDQQWQAIAPLLRRSKKAGRPPADARVTLNGILFVLHTQSAWRAVPKCYGNYVTCWRRLLRWQNAGIWPRIEAVLGLDPHLAQKAPRLH